MMVKTITVKRAKELALYNSIDGLEYLTCAELDRDYDSSFWRVIFKFSSSDQLYALDYLRNSITFDRSVKTSNGLTIILQKTDITNEKYRIKVIPVKKVVVAKQIKQTKYIEED